MTLLRLGIRVRADRAEVALARLLPLLEAGALERPRVVEQIRSLAGDALLGVRAEPVADGWEVRWHEHLRPVRVGDQVVRPPWIDGSPDDLVIDPGTFFGAGTHATTRLCLELLQDCPPDGALCDWGAGTGVLAIAAARLGWSPVTAVELDAGALDLIRSNAARNHVTVEALTGDVRESAPWAPTVVANLQKPLLLDAARTTAPERIIAAGMLAREAGEVAAAFAPLRERRRVEDDGWAALVLA